MRRKESLYAIIGGIVGAVLTIAVCSVLPIGAQSQSDRVFGEITCTGLKVVDAERKTTVLLQSGAFGGIVLVYGEGNTVAEMAIAPHGGRVFLRSSGNNAGSVNMEFDDEHGGEIRVYGEEGSVKLGTNKHGAGVYVTDQNGRTRASITSSELVGGVLGVAGENEEPLVVISPNLMNQNTPVGGMVNVFGSGMADGVRLSVNKDGGIVSVFGKEDGKSLAAMGVNEYGSGAVSTWDKNGYRLK